MLEKSLHLGALKNENPCHNYQLGVGETSPRSTGRDGRSSGYLENWGDGNWLIFNFGHFFINGFDKLLALYKFSRGEDDRSIRFSDKHRSGGGKGILQDNLCLYYNLRSLRALHSSSSGAWEIGWAFGPTFWAGIQSIPNSFNLKLKLLGIQLVDPTYPGHPLF